MSWQAVALVAGVVGTVAPVRRVSPPVAAAAVATASILLGVVPTSAFGDALDALASPMAFLVLAVPLAVLLDDVGFFASVAALVDGGRHLRVGLWALAAAVTVLFNLDAAVVLLTPLYVHIARRHGDDVLALAFVPALMASLASTVLPVSNLTNLVVAERLDLTITDFLVNAAPAALAATIVGWFAHRRTFPVPLGAIVHDDPADGHALRVGVPVVGWLLIGFTVGEHLGAPAWTVAAVAVAGLSIGTRRLPWRSVPAGPAVLALALGTLAVAAAPALHLDRVFGIDGLPGEAAVFSAAAAGANVVNNLPATVVALPSLDAHPDRAWALLLGVNLGPTLWISGALSSLLWQSTMARLGHVVTPGRYAAVGWRVGVPALVVAIGIRLVAAA